MTDSCANGDCCLQLAAKALLLGKVGGHFTGVPKLWSPGNVLTLAAERRIVAIPGIAVNASFPGVLRITLESIFRNRILPRFSGRLNGEDTTEFACDSIAVWWHEYGRQQYPDAKKLLILCDGGGSNSASKYVFEEDLQGLVNRLGLEIRVAHYPPYCSEYNPIEHRLFPHVTRACKRVIFQTPEIAQRAMEKNRDNHRPQGSRGLAAQGVQNRPQVCS
jgi:hypothetical protein